MQECAAFKEHIHCCCEHTELGDKKYDYAPVPCLQLFRSCLAPRQTVLLITPAVCLCSATLVMSICSMSAVMSIHDIPVMVPMRVICCGRTPVVPAVIISAVPLV